MFKKNGQPPPCLVHSYEQHKGDIQPVLRKLVLKERVTHQEWQNLFHHVHMVCSWDTNGTHKLIKCIERELCTHYIAPLKERLKSVDDGYQQLKEYVIFWKDFTRHCETLPMAFQQLDLATRDALIGGKFHSSTSSYLVKHHHHQSDEKSDHSDKLTFHGGNGGSGSKKKQSRLSQSPKMSSRIANFKSKDQCSVVRCVILRLWADKILNPIVDRLMNSTRELIMRERCGFIIDSSLITSLRESLAYLDILQAINYHQDYMIRFEQMYVESVGLFYSPIPDEYLREHGVIGYIGWALEKFEREEHNAAKYLESNSAAIKRVAEACNNALIKNFVEQIIRASPSYIQASDAVSMKLIYRFFNKVDGLVEPFLEEICKHFISHGLAHLTGLDPVQASRPDFFVERLLEIHSDFAKTVLRVFNNDPRACATLERALGCIINDSRIFKSFYSTEQNSENDPARSDPESRCAEMLAHYCNILFRKSPLSRKLSNDELNRRLDQLLIITKLLKDKEAFIRYHKLHLVKRLIPDASNNIEKEEEFVTRLRDISGIPLEETVEIMRMFKDLKTSEILGVKFNQFFKPSIDNVNNNNTISNISSQMTDRLSIDEANAQMPPINVKVLNPNAWLKNFDKSPLPLPNNIAMVMPAYEAFYKDQFEGRELEWRPHLSNGVISFENNQGNKYELEVTAAQLAILFSYNEQPSSLKTLEELKLSTNLTINDLRRTIWSLVSNPKLKVQILKCEPPIGTQKDLDRPDNLYSVNRDFVLIMSWFFTTTT